MIRRAGLISTKSFKTINLCSKNPAHLSTTVRYTSTVGSVDTSKNSKAPKDNTARSDKQGANVVAEGVDMKTSKAEKKDMINELNKYAKDLDDSSWMKTEMSEKIQETVRNAYPTEPEKRESKEAQLKHKQQQKPHRAQ